MTVESMTVTESGKDIEVKGNKDGTYTIDDAERQLKDGDVLRYEITMKVKVDDSYKFENKGYGNEVENPSFGDLDDKSNNGGEFPIKDKDENTPGDNGGNKPGDNGGNNGGNGDGGNGNSNGGNNPGDNGGNNGGNGDGSNSSDGGNGSSDGSGNSNSGTKKKSSGATDGNANNPYTGGFDEGSKSGVAGGGRAGLANGGAYQPIDGSATGTGTPSTGGASVNTGGHTENPGFWSKLFGVFFGK